jgi:hypothetical protein
VLGTFRVVKESPILKVQLLRDTGATADSRDTSARLGLADVTVVVMPDHKNLCHATYEPFPGSGSVLSFELPSGSDLLWATIDSNPVTPARSKSGEWSIPLEGSRQPRIGLVWQTNATHPGSTASDSLIELPRAGHGMTTNLVTVYVPDQHSLAGEVAGLRPASRQRQEMARADWLLRSISDFVVRIDRSSNRDHQKLVSMLIGHEMHLRSAVRSEQGTSRGGDTKSGPAGGDPGWIQAARASRVDAVRSAGLEEYLAIANRYLGESSPGKPQASPSVPEPVAPERIRTLGRPIPLLGPLPGVDAPPAKTSLQVAGQPWNDGAAVLESRTIIALLMFIVLGLLTAGLRPGVATNAAALLMALVLAGYIGGPLALLGAPALALLGFRRGRMASFT